MEYIENVFFVRYEVSPQEELSIEQVTK